MRRWIGNFRGRPIGPGNSEPAIRSRTPRTAALRALVAASVLMALAGCSPQAMLISSLIPDGTTSVLLSHLESEEEGNRKRVAELESRKDWDGLVKLAEESLAKDPRYAGWWFVAGYAHTQAGRHLRAVESYRKMAELSPDDMVAWELLAQAQLSSGQPQRAARTLNNALRVRDDAPTTWLLLGQSYEDLFRPDLAVGAYRAAVKLDNNFAQAWFGLGRAYARLDRRPEFEQALKTLERLNPSLAKQLAGMRPAPRR